MKNSITKCHNNLIKYTDPSGHFAITASVIIGAIVFGAIVGASIDAGSQMIFEDKSFEELNWSSIRMSALEGAIAGGIGAVTGGAGYGLAATMAIEGATGFTANVISQQLIYGEVNWQEAALSGTIDTVTAGLGHEMGMLLKNTGLDEVISTSINKAKSSVIDAVQVGIRTLDNSWSPRYAVAGMDLNINASSFTNQLDDSADISVRNAIQENIDDVSNQAKFGSVSEGMDEVVPNKALLPDEGNVGTYKELVDAGTRGDNITPHHMPSAEYMSNYGVAKNNGVSMNMEQPFPGSGGRHRLTDTYGRNMTDAQKSVYYNMSPREALAHDLFNARSIYINDGLYNQQIRNSLLEVINQNKKLYPDLFNK